MKKLGYVVSALLGLAGSSFGGSIIVNNDEWALSNTGFAVAGGSNAQNFAQNSALFLTGGPNGGATKIWIDSDNFGLDQSDLLGALSAYSVTDTGFSNFTLANLQNFQAVFLSGDALTGAEITALTAYVNGGGGVYIAAGTGNIAGGAAGEAGLWNPFLNAFNLNLGAPYNGVFGNLPPNSGSPLFNGVTQLFFDNGNTVTATGAGAQIVMSTGAAAPIGLIGTFSTSTPEPATIILVGLGLFGVGTYRKLRA